MSHCTPVCGKHIVAYADKADVSPCPVCALTAERERSRVLETALANLAAFVQKLPELGYVHCHSQEPICFSPDGPLAKGWAALAAANANPAQSSGATDAQLIDWLQNWLQSRGDPWSSPSLTAGGFSGFNLRMIAHDGSARTIASDVDFRAAIRKAMAQDAALAATEGKTP